MKAGELRDIVDKIVKTQKTNLGEVAIKVGSNRSYLSNLFNEDEEKEITDKLFRKFQTTFPAHFPKTNKTNGRYAPHSDLQTHLRGLTETGIRHEAAINILTVTLAEFVAAKSGKGIAYEHSALQKAISLESDRLLSERKRKP